MNKILKVVLNAMKKLMINGYSLQNKIVLESHPELSGNTNEVFEKLLEKNVNRQYKIYWLVEDKKKYKRYKVKNVKFLELQPSTLKEKLLKEYTIHRSKLIVTENRIIHKTNPKTFTLHLHHGTVLKDVSGIYNFGRGYNKILCPSEHLVELYSRLFRVDKDQIVVNGAPRNDLLMKPNDSIEKLGFASFSKIILWMPTFRQHKNGVRNDTAKNLPLGIPIIYSKADLKRLNDFLKQLNYLFVLKLHPSQDKSYLELDSLTNLIVIEDTYLKEKNIKLYEFIGQTDALITDYSSIYYDYLLLNKPIGLTIDDIDSYKLGFVYKNIEDYLVGEKIATVHELEQFIKNMDRDSLQKQKKSTSQKMNGTVQSEFTEQLFVKVLKHVL